MEKHKDLDSHDQAILDAVEEKLVPMRVQMSILDRHLELLAKAFVETVIAVESINREGAKYA